MSNDKKMLKFALDYYLEEIKYHKRCILELEKECIKLYSDLKKIDKETHNEK